MLAKVMRVRSLSRQRGARRVHFDLFDLIFPLLRMKATVGGSALGPSYVDSLLEGIVEVLRSQCGYGFLYGHFSFVRARSNTRKKKRRGCVRATYSSALQSGHSHTKYHMEK